MVCEPASESESRIVLDQVAACVPIDHPIFGVAFLLVVFRELYPRDTRRPWALPRQELIA